MSISFTCVLLTFLWSLSMAENYEGPMWGMFYPEIVEMVTKCDNKPGNVCLQLPTKKVVIVLQITAAAAKKKHKEKESMNLESDESIENLLYYKDCKHQNSKVTPAILRATEAPTVPACPCPRMCCSMCCDCDAPSPFASRQMAPLQSPNVEPQGTPQHLPRRPMPQTQMMSPMMIHQPQFMQQRVKKKKPAKEEPKQPQPQPNMMQPPIGSRRNLGFTRENIKSLISHDQDIKKILKDLVRVTMRKVDLAEKQDSRRNVGVARSTTEPPMVADDEDYYID